MHWTVIRVACLVTYCHNEARDTLGDLVDLAYRTGDVIHEHIVYECGDSVPALIADLRIRGVWLPQVEALFDIILCRCTILYVSSCY